MEIIGAYSVNGNAGALVDLDFPNAKVANKGKLVVFANKVAEAVASNGGLHSSFSEVEIFTPDTILQADIENGGVLKPNDPNNENAMKILRLERWVLGEI